MAKGLNLVATNNTIHTAKLSDQIQTDERSSYHLVPRFNSIASETKSGSIFA